MMPDRDFALVYKEEVYDKFCTPKSKLDRTKKPELLSFYHEAANYLEMQLTCSYMCQMMMNKMCSVK